MKMRSLASKLAIVFSVALFLVTVVGLKVLDPVGCPAKIHCTTVFALRIGNFLRLGVVTHPMSI